MAQKEVVTFYDLDPDEKRAIEESAVKANEAEGGSTTDVDALSPVKDSSDLIQEDESSETIQSSTTDDKQGNNIEEQELLTDFERLQKLRTLSKMMMDAKEGDLVRNYVCQIQELAHIASALWVACSAFLLGDLTRKELLITADEYAEAILKAIIRNELSSISKKYDVSMSVIEAIASKLKSDK